MTFLGRNEDNFRRASELFWYTRTYVMSKYGGINLYLHVIGYFFQKLILIWLEHKKYTTTTTNKGKKKL
jgi:hypothetical protein